MSRHRDIRNLNIHDEMDDDPISDGGEEDMTPEDQVKMETSYAQVKEFLSDEDLINIPDQDLRDFLWYNFFDVERAIEWCLQERETRAVAKERKAFYLPQDQPSTPKSDTVFDPDGQYPPTAYTNGGSRVPLIVLAQQEQQQRELERLQSLRRQEDAVMEDEDRESSTGSSTPRPGWKLLSTISERTERTEPSPYWASTYNQLLSPPHPRAPSSSAATSYGQVIERNRSIGEEPWSLDPNIIPVSPSGSAVHRLSSYEPAPSLPDSGTYTPSSASPRPPSVDVPPVDTIPEIPDQTSKSTLPQPQQQAKKSKLSLLASSRASTASTRSSVRSESSQNTGIEKSGSIKTYPALRPASQSLHTPSTLLTPPPSSPSRVTSSASMESHVRRAIQTALDLENADQVTVSVKSKALPPTPSALSTVSSERIKAATDNRLSAPTPSKGADLPSSTDPTPTKARPQSKLALLAQAKAGSKVAKAPAADPKSSELLAKPVKPPPPGHLPPEHTEYLMPIANGPTVTTAITTSYQSLYSLTDPSRSPIPPTPFVVPLSGLPPSGQDGKPSKLAMKSRRAQESQAASRLPIENAVPVPIPPVFLPKSSHARALPSKFASLLIDDETIQSDSTHAKEARRKTKGKMRQVSTPTASEPASVASDESEDHQHHHHHKTRKHRKSTPVLGVPSSFAFDVPSPDDLVFSARKGTALSHHRDRETSSRGTNKSSSISFKA